MLLYTFSQEEWKERRIVAQVFGSKFVVKQEESTLGGMVGGEQTAWREALWRPKESGDF